MATVDAAPGSKGQGHVVVQIHPALPKGLVPSRAPHWWALGKAEASLEFQLKKFEEVTVDVYELLKKIRCQR